MVLRFVRNVVLTVLTGLILTGCGRQVVKTPAKGPDLPATGPASPSTLRPFLAPSVEAVGGYPAWRACTKLDFDAIVTAFRTDGGAYLTEHHFVVSPWSDAIQVLAREPRVRISWIVSCGRCALSGDSSLDVSPLNGSYHEYADGVLQLVTVSARVMDSNVTLNRRPIPVQIAGQWYQQVEAAFGARETVSSEKGDKRIAICEPYWTQGTYFQNRASSIVDMIWLGNPGEQRYLLVRGYDYARVGSDDVLIPAKIEIFRSDAGAHFGPRLAQIDLTR